MKKKRYLKQSAQLPARAAAETRHLTARSGVEVLYWSLVQNMLVQRERRNDLPELTPQRAQELFEAWRRGEMADVQLMWDQLEERDDTLMVVLNARLSALAEMPWAVVPDADAVGDDPQRQALAEEQKRTLMSLFTAVENLEDALRHLGMADFRGVAALEIVGDAARMRWEVIEPWNLCRPVRRGPWLYNAEASATPARLEAFEPGSVIIREAMPIDLPAMYLISSLHHSVHSWDGFLEVFGIPNIFMEMPPATPEEKALEFDAVVQRLIGEGRGTVPNGAKFHTVETSKDNSQSFEARYKVCREAIITLATGGLLTVGTAPNSGTLAGSAHSDSFSRLCAASARSISSVINRQFVRRVLAETFPGQPVLVQFELAPEPVDDRKQLAELLSALNAAGWAPSAETVSEMMNFEVQRVQQPPTDTNTQAQPVMNRADAPGFESASEEEDSVESPAESEPPLNEGELAALRLLGGGLNPEQVAADAAFMAEAMRESTIDELRRTNSNNAALRADGDEVVVNSCNQYGHEEGCDGADDEEEERREREMDASSMESAGYTPEEIERVTGIKITDDEETVTNAAVRVFKRDNLGRFAATGAVLRKNKGGRGSKGNPKSLRIKSNTPLKAARLAKPQAQVDAVEHALKAMEGGGSVVKGAAWVKGKRLDVKGGSPNTGGASHMTKHYKPGDTSRRKAAKDTILGRKQKDRTEVASVGKKNKVILADKGDHLEPVTTRRKTDND